MKFLVYNRAFTIIELLVVIAILGILASVVLSSVTGHRERARDALRLVGIDQINTAIIAYTLEHGIPPGDDAVMYVNGTSDWIPGLVPDFVTALPTDPRDTTDYSFRYMRQGSDYVLAARFENEESPHASGDGGQSDNHYEIASGAHFALTDAEESDWRFTDATEVRTHLSCPNPGGQVTICHVPPGNPENAQTITVACTALGPKGHSNHEGDYLGSCTGDEGGDTGGDDDGGDSGGDDGGDEPPVEDDCPVTITPALDSYVSGDDVQLSWDSTCYPSSQVMLEVRKVTTGESSSHIMIYSAANNDGDYPYQGFPTGLIGSDEWVVRVTDYNIRTNWDESAEFRVTDAAPLTTYTITASAGVGGTISPSGAVSVQGGASQMFTVTPAEGYLLESLIVDGSPQATTSSYTFEVVDEDHVIEVTFAAEAQPEITELTIHGRFVHAFTDVPIQGVPVRGAIPPAIAKSIVATSDANGEFTVTTTVADLEPGGAIRPFTYKMSCYFSSQNDNLATVKRYDDGRLGILHNPFDLIIRGSKYIDPVTTSYVDLGDIPLWPAKSITINSDVPVQFVIPYTEEAHTSGNVLLKTEHRLNDVVALDYDVAVTLTDGDGAVYESPVQHYAADANCDRAILNFENGIAAWE
jgi:prepilin-type N-terminal cleavage/methylation domain-containing protein